MSLRRTLALTLGAVALAGGGVAAAYGVARAAQSQIVVERFLVGYYDRRGRFIPTAGRGATNVDRNALFMFVFSGPVDTGRNVRASLPLTLAEQAELEARQQEDPEYDPTRDGYEPGIVPRRRSEDRAAYYVATGSIDADAVQITVPAGGGSADAEGQFFKVLDGNGRVMRNRLLFNPRYLAATFNQPGHIDYNPEGLDSGAIYDVVLDGGPNPIDAFSLVRNLDGESMASRFVTRITTGTRYVQDFSRPSIRETSPGDKTVNVPSDADIDLSFSEPMDIRSFTIPRFQGDDAWSVNARYAQTVGNGILAGRNILGQVRVKPQTAGNVVQFRPLQGFGKGPYDVEVVVTNVVTDLSGNNIIRQFQISFQSEFDPNAEDFSEKVETFDTTTMRDPQFLPTGDHVPAVWNGTTTKGLLTTSVNEVNFDVNGPGAPTNLGPSNGINVWSLFALRIQMFFPGSEAGGRARTLSGFSWLTGAYVGTLTYPNTTVQLGHPNSTVGASGFAPGGGPTTANFGDTPILVTPATSYNPNNITSNTYVRGPTWVKNFNYDGSSGMVMEISHNGNGTAATQERWRYDAAYAINASTVFIASTGVNQTNNWLYSTRIHYLTPGAEAQSLFYDLGRSDARLQPQQLVPQTQPQGTSVVLIWQGAREDVANPGQIDASSYSAWVSDIRTLANNRFIRFRCTLVNDLTGRVSPQVDTITIPFTFK